MNLTNLKILLFFVIIVFHSDIYSQNIFSKKFFSDFCFTASINYISSATIQQNPNNSDIIERNSTTTLKGGYGYGFTLKKRIFGDDIFLGISTEYVKITDDQLSTTLENNSDFQGVRVTETVEMIPVELSMYFNIPRFADKLNVYLGGGFGFYFGNRTRKMLNMETTTISKSPLFSLNVLFGAEYFVDNNFSFILEMKVRDGKYKVHNHFPINNATLNGQTYYFNDDYESKIFIDGLKMSLGVGYYF